MCLSVFQDPFHKSQVVGRPTNLVSKRPDSKDISSRYPTLPPIEENRLKNNQISTVFEPEAWTRQYRTDNKENYGSPRRPYNSSEADRTNGYRPLYDPRGSGAYGSRHSDPALLNGVRHSYDSFPARRSQETPLSKEEFVKKLTGMLPKNVFLPDHPIILSEEDEVCLEDVLHMQCSRSCGLWIQYKLM